MDQSVDRVPDQFSSVRRRFRSEPSQKQSTGEANQTASELGGVFERVSEMCVTEDIFGTERGRVTVVHVTRPPD